MSESKIITHCLECGSSDIVKTINSFESDSYHCDKCGQEYFESVKYDTATVSAFQVLESENNELKKQLSESLEREKKLREGLQFYGDHENWHDIRKNCNIYFQTIVDEDDFVYGNLGQVWAGEHARAILSDLYENSDGKSKTLEKYVKE